MAQTVAAPASGPAHGPIAIEQGDLRLVVLPGLGAGISDFSIRGPAKFHYPLMRRAPHAETPPSASNLASFIMAPWCNRIPAGAFTFRGREHALRPTSADGSAIHGDVRARPWKILDRAPASARLRIDSREHAGFNFPFECSVLVRYELDPAGLTTELSVTNEGDAPMPAGCGLHPYFPRRLWSERDVVELSAPCGGRYHGRDTVPERPAERDALVDHLRSLHPLPDAVRDSEIFGGFSGPAIIRWPASGVELQITCSANLSHLVLFCPHQHEGRESPLPHFALEPQTHVTDAINLAERGWENTGLVVLEPGRTLATRTRIDVRRL